MPESSFDHPLFGTVRFRTNSPVWIRGDGITFLSGFDVDDITRIVIPQLKDVPGSNKGKLRFHKRAHAQLSTVFQDIERLNLLRHIKTCAGSLNFRLRKPTNGSLSKLPSNHAFGIAIDLNADDGSNGASVAPVAPVFEALGFKWGVSFNDPMHFEVEEFIEEPDPVSPHLAAFLK
jgi:D-alanyl-D-alanine carboxypeptidase